MRYKKVSSIVFSLSFLCILLSSMFNICKADNQATGNSLKGVVGAKSICVLGEKVKGFPFYVYKDADSGENNFFPTGIMGDLSGTEINTFWKELPYSGPSCIKIAYEVKSGQAYGWAGLYWQHPPNNWGNIPKAYDLTGATKLTFWARGEYGGEIINKFQVGGIAGKYRDSGVASIGPITLSKEWNKYTVDLRGMHNSIIISNEDKECWPFMEPLSRILGGFCWATTPMVNNHNSIIFYLDEIKFEND